jgi:hypothetical protein
MVIVMRTPLNLPEEMVRSSLEASSTIDLSNNFPCFAMNADAEPITMQRTLELEDAW